MESQEKPSLILQLLRLSLPIMIGNLLQTLYNMADAFFLGKLGKEAISAPSITMNISNFIIVFGAAFSIAGTTMLSQAYGANKENKERLDFLASQIFLVNFVMSLVVTFSGFFLTRPLMNIMKVPSGLTYDYTYQYMSITFLTMPLMFIDFILRGILQGIGNSITPLFVQSFSVLLNVVLDPIFIFGWGPIPPMQVSGAAWATFIARLFSSAVSLIILFGGFKGIKVHFKLLKPEKRTLTLMTKIGLPAAVGQSVSSLGFAVIQQVVNTFGTAVIAAFGVGNRIQSLFNMPAQGISQATAILVGNNLGRSDDKKASKIVLIATAVSGAFITVGMVLVLIFGPYVIRFFVDDPDVIKHGVTMFKYTTTGVILFAVFTVVLGAFQGGGETKVVMILNIVRLWVIRVPLCYLLPWLFNFGAVGIWIAMLISNLVVSFWSFILFAKGKWKKRINF
ncbi:MAG: MATE family efflux transporter [Sphaerochaetaceae bacterium]